MPSPVYMARKRRDWLDDDRYCEQDVDMDQPSVVWVDDQRFVRRMRDEAQYAEIPIPAPTQRAMPIVDPDSPVSAPSSRTSRKRPRRNVRASLPLYDTQASYAASMQTAGPSSAPFDGASLDDLLEQANKLYVEPPTKSARRNRQGSAMPQASLSSSHQPGSGSGMALREASVNSPRKARAAGSPGKNRFSQPFNPPKMYKTLSLPHTSSEDSMTSASTATDDSTVPITPTRTEHVTDSARPPRASEPSAFTSPQQSCKPGMSVTNTVNGAVAPRIGMRSVNVASANKASAIATPAKLQKAFKSPIAQPTRSSPRNHKSPIQMQPPPARPALRAMAQGPTWAADGMTPAERRRAAIRQGQQHEQQLSKPIASHQPPPAPAPAIRQSNHQFDRGPQPIAQQIPARQSQPKQNQPQLRSAQQRPAPQAHDRPQLQHRASSPEVADTKIPSSDGIGNESFDSFDGVLEEGGEDVEALLRAIDGASD